MLRLTAKAIWAHKRRLVGTVLAVVLGVAFLAGTLVLGDTMRAGFGAAFEQANAGTDAVVRSSTTVGGGEDEVRAGIDASLLEQVRAVPGVAAAEPVVAGPAQIVSADGDPIGGNGPPTVGSSWIEDEALNSYDVAEGRAPEAPGEVVIDRASAETAELAVGDETTLVTPAPVPVEVVGIASFGSSDSLGATTYAGLVFDQAAELFAPARGQVSQVRVAAEDGTSQEALAASIAEALPGDADAEVLTGAELTAEQREAIESDFLGFFETLLLVFAGVALLVAAFSIANTFAIVAAQRTRESALLRALGASRRQVLASTLAEAALLAAVASGLGLLAGVGLAAGLSSLMASFTDLELGGLVLDGATVATGIAVGFGVTLLASLVPAVRASRVAPLAALRDAAVERTDLPRVRTVVGALLALAGVSAVVWGVTGTGDSATSVVGLGAVAALVGVVAVAPALARPTSRVFGAPVVALRGTTGRLARENAGRNPRRTAATASALLVGVSVVTLFTVFASSVKASIDESVSRSFEGDLVVATDELSGAGLDPAMAGEIDALDEVDATGVGDGSLDLTGEAAFPAVVDPAEVQRFMDLDVAEGSVEDLAPEGIAVAVDTAADEGWELGTELPVTYPDGTDGTVEVQALYEETDLMGDLLLPVDGWTPHAGTPTDVVVMVSLADGVSLEEGRAAVAEVTDRFLAPDPLDSEEYLGEVAAEIDQALVIVYALLVLAILIALMGIANTLSLSIHERTRELGLLRAVGQSRRQLRSMVRWEAVFTSLLGTTCGVGLGLVLGWAFFRTVAESEGVEAVFTVPTGSLLVILGLGALVGVVAAARPARRAARMDVLAAIAQA